MSRMKPRMRSCRWERCSGESEERIYLLDAWRESPLYSEREPNRPAAVRYAYGERLASVIHLAAYYDFSGEPSEL